MRIAVLGLALAFALPARADDCASVRRTRALATSSGIDSTNLLVLEQRMCTGGRNITRASRECSTLLVMEELALAASDDATLIATVSAARVTACVAPNETAIIDWPNGVRAVSGESWRYPNGQTARSITGAWYYPTGASARSLSGAWSYPDGQTALAGERWRAPGGDAFRTPGELTTWACSIGGYGCREVVEEMPTLPAIVQEAAMVRVAWHAHLATAAY